MRFSFLVLLSGTIAAYGHTPETSLPFENPHAHEHIEGHVHVQWDSHYFSEGRDMLDGDALCTGSAEIGWKSLAGGVWYGRSPDQDYDELQLSLVWTGHAGDFEYYGGYTHLRAPSDDSHDHEIGAGLAWSGMPLQCVLGMDAYYSFDAGGLFAETSLNREFEITDRFTLHLSGVFGLNLGYVPDGHDGPNHIALRLGAEHALTDSVSLTAHVASSWALGKDSSAPGDDLLVDFIHGGIGLEWSF